MKFIAILAAAAAAQDAKTATTTIATVGDVAAQPPLLKKSHKKVHKGKKHGMDPVTKAAVGGVAEGVASAVTQNANFLGVNDNNPIGIGAQQVVGQVFETALGTATLEGLDETFLSGVAWGVGQNLVDESSIPFLADNPVAMKFADNFAAGFLSGIVGCKGNLVCKAGKKRPPPMIQGFKWGLAAGLSCLLTGGATCGMAFVKTASQVALSTALKNSINDATVGTGKQSVPGNALGGATAAAVIKGVFPARRLEAIRVEASPKL